MLKVSKSLSALVLALGLGACMQAPDPAIGSVAAGAAIGATTAAAFGGSRTDIAASAIVGGVAGAAVAAQN